MHERHATKLAHFLLTNLKKEIDKFIHFQGIGEAEFLTQELDHEHITAPELAVFGIKPWLYPGPANVEVGSS